MNIPKWIIQPALKYKISGIFCFDNWFQASVQKVVFSDHALSSVDGSSFLKMNQARLERVLTNLQ